VEPVRQPAHLGALGLGVVADRPLGGPQLGAHIAIGEPMERMRAAHEGAEELGIDAGDGIEGLDRPAGRRDLGHGDGIETTNDRNLLFGSRRE